MNSSYPSFFSENSNRSFPFIENTASSKVKNSCFIDFKCWTRFKTHESPSLYLVANYSADLPNEYKQFLLDGFCTLFFLVHRVPENEHVFNGMICVYIPLDNSQWPYLGVSSVWNSSGIKMFELRTLVNSSVLDIASNPDNYLFPSNFFGNQGDIGLKIEPTQVIYSGNIVIDELNIVDQDGYHKKNINGDVKVSPGYNSYIYQADKKFTINSSANIGSGKRYNDEKNDICNGVFSINGVTPDESGNFKIEGDNGVLIFNLPEEYKIVVAIDPKTKIAKCQT